MEDGDARHDMALRSGVVYVRVKMSRAGFLETDQTPHQVCCYVGDCPFNSVWHEPEGVEMVLPPVPYIKSALRYA